MAKNRKEEPVKARVVGLWGDPGLTEYYNYDVLSRFLLVQVAPYNEVPTPNDASTIVKLVLRPESLWIKHVVTSAGAQRRDFYGNINNQLISPTDNPPNNGRNAATFSDKNILPITQSYKVGDELILNKLSQPLHFDSPSQPVLLNPANPPSATNQPIGSTGRCQFNGTNIFLSDQAYTASSFMSQAYKDSASVPTISTLNVFSYLLSVGGSDFNVVMNSGATPTTANTGPYLASLGKILASAQKYTEIINAGISTQMGLSLLLGLRGGLFGRYLYKSVEYIDSNADNRERPRDSGCLPLIVANPSTFPTPANRNLGGINITL